MGVRTMGEITSIRTETFMDQINITSFDQHFAIRMESWKAFTMWFLLV
jgi:hypothetical protein